MKVYLMILSLILIGISATLFYIVFTNPNYISLLQIAMIAQINAWLPIVILVGGFISTIAVIGLILKLTEYLKDK